MIKNLYVSLLIIAIILPSAMLKAESNVGTLAGYFDLIVSGNIESAYYLWTAECRERASRFGIEYENIPLKIDCYSPVVKDIETMRNHLQPPVKRSSKLPRGFSTLKYSALVKGELTEYTYYMRNVDNYFWLTFPQEYYAAGWATKQTKYFNIRYDSSLENSLNEINLAAADNFIESMAKKLQLSNDDLKMIAEKKIEYIYCESDSQVKEITGHLVKGTYDMPSNDIISAFFPHYHEIVHLLVNIKLRKLPLYTLPLMREGIAVDLGGRWGKAPKTLAVIGEYLLAEDIVSLDSIITFSDFNKVATSNIAYSVAGLFSGYLIDRLGIDSYFKLYRELSGDFKTLLFLSADDIKQKFVASVKLKNWDDLQTDFRSYLDDVLKNAQLTPGINDAKKEIYNANGIIIREDKKFYTFEISAQEKDTVAGNILFDKEQSLAGKSSSLFNEQYKLEKEFLGYRFGIRYDRNEVGVYDYASNLLIAKYIWSLNPSDKYFDDTKHKLFFKVKKNVLPMKLNKKTDFSLLQN